MQRHGFTIASVLVACAIVGVLLGLAGTWGSRSIVLNDAVGSVARALRFHRLQAVVLSEGPGVACIAAVHVMPSVTLVWPPRGLLFTPDGLPRTCDGGGVGNTTILLEHRGRQAAVVVSSLGRVRWELR